jgi:hypothetical protein
MANGTAYRFRAGTFGGSSPPVPTIKSIRGCLGISLYRRRVALYLIGSGHRKDLANGGRRAPLLVSGILAREERDVIHQPDWVCDCGVSEYKGLSNDLTTSRIDQTARLSRLVDIVL